MSPSPNREDLSDHDLLIRLDEKMDRMADDNSAFKKALYGEDGQGGICGRLTAIERKHEGETAVISFLDTTLGRVVAVLTCFSISAALVCVYVVPVIVKVMI